MKTRAPAIFVARHFDEEGDSAFRPLSEYLTLLGYVVLQGGERTSSMIPYRIQNRIAEADIIITLITGQRDHDWLHAESAYAKAQNKRILLEYVRDACNFSRLVMCPARFTYLDSKPIF